MLHAPSAVRQSMGPSDRVSGDGWCTGVSCRLLAGREERSEKRDQRGHLGRVQILAICGHLPATLQHLADQLVVREPGGHVVERRSALSALASQAVTVTALLALHEQRALQLQ